MERKPKSLPLIIGIVLYFFLVSLPDTFRLFQGLDASPQWLIQRRRLPEEVVAQDLGEEYVKLERAARRGEPICLSPELYAQTVASGSGFAKYFVFGRSVSTDCQKGSQ